MNIQFLAAKLGLIITEFGKSSFVRNILVVMSGTAVAQVIGFALTPIISRLYSPSEFGVFGSFSAVFAVIVAGATLQYSQAIMLPKENGNAFNLFFVSSLCTLSLSIVCLAVCVVAPAVVNNLMKTSGVWALALLVIGVFVAGFGQSCQAWSVRVKAFKHTSGSQVIRSLTSNGAKIGFGYLKGGTEALVVSTILADMLASLNLVRALLPDFFRLRGYVRWERMKELAREYVDFPMYSASQNVINALSSGMPVLILTHHFGIAVAGAYAFGVNVLQVPMGFVLTALRQVLFQKAAETQHSGGSLTNLYFKTTGGLFAIAILPSLILFISSPQLFSWFFGSQWHMAGELARSLVIWLSLAFCNLPAILFARIIRIQRFVFLYDLVLLAARSSALVLGGMYLNALQTVMLFSVVGAVMNGILIFRVGYCVVKKEGRTSLFGLA